MVIVVPIVLPELTRRGFKVSKRIIPDGSSFGGETENVVVSSADDLL